MCVYLYIYICIYTSKRWQATSQIQQVGLAWPVMWVQHLKLDPAVVWCILPPLRSLVFHQPCLFPTRFQGLHNIPLSYQPRTANDVHFPKERICGDWLEVDYQPFGSCLPERASREAFLKEAMRADCGGYSEKRFKNTPQSRSILPSGFRVFHQSKRTSFRSSFVDLL